MCVYVMQVHTVTVPVTLFDKTVSPKETLDEGREKDYFSKQQKETTKSDSVRVGLGGHK